MSASRDYCAPRFDTSEAGGVQRPALELLAKLGWSVLSRAEAEAQRRGRLTDTILEDILAERMHALNGVTQRGRTFPVTDGVVVEAIGRLKAVGADMTSGTMTATERTTEMLQLGTGVPMTIEGETRERQLRFVDWKVPANNRFHAVAEFKVYRERAEGSRRPDIVLFVNGIPFVVIEVKKSAESTSQGISQQIRNQGLSEIPQLFSTAQILVAANPSDPRYATSGTPAKFWALWREREIGDETVARIMARPLDPRDANVVASEFSADRHGYEGIEEEAARLPTELDRTLVALLSPERLLELSLGFTLFDNGVKKIARYQQYFGVKNTLVRISQREEDGRRRGGVIWHTQGSGKSLTMVMLAKAIARAIENPRIVLVTDRKDLDRQLRDTFRAAGYEGEVRQAMTGRQLLDFVEERAGLVSTTLHKFKAGLRSRKVSDESADVFLLIDESHRSQTIRDEEALRRQMQKVFPRGCYIGLTGTPLMKAEQSTFTQFGALIDAYTIDQAVKDKAVVPLLYESRHVEANAGEDVDRWAERVLKTLSERKREILKRQIARGREVRGAEPWLMEVAADVADDFRANWRGTPYRGQLVAETKAAAVTLHKLLQDEGIDSAVVISEGDERQGFEAVNRDPDGVVAAFWKEVKAGETAEAYERRIISSFIGGEGPEIIVVVSKLLTGFDAPRNRVLYLARSMQDHGLLQAIARVNRLFSQGGEEEEEAFDKEDGRIIDYVGLLGDLDKAMTAYSAFEGYDEEDVAGALVALRERVEALPNAHAALLGLFQGIGNADDREAYERFLADSAIRDDFYARLHDFAKALAAAFSSEAFLETIEPRDLRRYKDDLKRFESLRRSVVHRYADSFDTKEMREYEGKLRKLLDRHITTDGMMTLVPAIDIFDEGALRRAAEDDGVSTAAKADAIASATAKTITVKMEEDPQLYRGFRDMLQGVLDEFKQGRLNEQDYFDRIRAVREKVVTREGESAVPETIRHDDLASAFWRSQLPLVEPLAGSEAFQITAEIAGAFSAIVTRHRHVGWQHNLDTEKAIRNDMDDYLYDEIKEAQGLCALDTELMDELIRQALELARRRVPA